MKSATEILGKDRILENAESLFTQHGFRGVSIRDIAKACQVTNAALYYHFPSKEALYVEVLEKFTYRLCERMRRAAQGAGSHRERVAAILMEYGHTIAGRFAPLFTPHPDRSHQARIKFRVQQEQLIRAVLRPLDDAVDQAVAAGELQPLPEGQSAAALLVGMLHGLIQYRQACLKEEFADENASLVVSIFWDGQAEPSVKPPSLLSR